MSCTPIDSIDSFYLIVMGALVLFMQAGFAMLESANVSINNVTNVLFKNTTDFVVTAILWYLWGFGIAFGAKESDFIGQDYFALQNTCDYAFWFFQFTFAATAATIVSGAVAERCSIIAYAAYCALVSGFVYPVVVYWAWSSRAWLTQGESDEEYVGFTDFAGSGVVHMTGGAAALAAIIMLGPRRRRVNPDGTLKALNPHSMPMASLGTFILIFGFVGFNAGSTLGIVDTDGAIGLQAAQAAVNTILAAAGSGLSSLVMVYIRTRRLSLSALNNGIIAGMVAICSGCGYVLPWAGLVIGLVAGIVCDLGSQLLFKLKIDDAIDAVTVHCFAGFWGLIGTGLFRTHRGIFFLASRHATWRFLGWQIAGGVTIFVWSFTLCLLLFAVLKYFDCLRVSEDVELNGLDHTEHAEKSYEFGGMVHTPHLHRKNKDGDLNGPIVEKVPVVESGGLAMTLTHL